MFFQPMLVVVGLSACMVVASVFLAVRTKSRSARVRWAVRAVAAALLLTAGLRPSASTLAPAEVYNNQYDVYFVVDLTSSVVAEDGPDNTTRLDLIREDINDLLDEYVGAKFALMTFNSSANLRVPLTPDSTAIASSVNTMLPEVTQYSTGSSISAPVELLKEVLETSSESNDRAKIMLYFGDGEQTSSESPESFAPLTEYLDQAKVYGYGTEEGGRMKVQSGYFISANEGDYIQFNNQDALSVIDETNLDKIAEELQGSYEHRTGDSRIAAAQLTDDQKLQLQQTEGSSINNTVEFYWVFLIFFSLTMFYEVAYLIRKAKLLGVNWK